MIKIYSLFNDLDDINWQTLETTGFWGKQAAGCVYFSNSTSRFCLAHRSSMVEQPKTWGTWGGAMDPGELPQDAVKRESYEETGYSGNIELIPLYVFSDPSGFKYHNFLAIVPEEFEPRMNWETQGFGWFEWDQWPSPLHFGFKLLLQDPNSCETMIKRCSR